MNRKDIKKVLDELTGDIDSITEALLLNPPALECSLKFKRIYSLQAFLTTSFYS